MAERLTRRVVWARMIDTMPKWPAYLLGVFAAACAGSAVNSLPTEDESYRALGVEPGWRLAIENGRIEFAANEGQTRISSFRWDPEATANGRRYRTPRVSVEIVSGACEEAASSQGYLDRVTVVADGRAYRGCGGARQPD